MTRPWDFSTISARRTSIEETRCYTARQELGDLQEEMAEAILEWESNRNGGTAYNMLNHLAEKIKAIIAKAEHVDPPRVLEIAKELEHEHHKREAMFDEWYSAPDMLARFLPAARRKYKEEQDA